MQAKTLWIVVPCYNEEEMLPKTSVALKCVIEDLIANGKIAENSKIAFVNDGSKDKTWEIIENLYKTNSLYVGVNLSRNRGHQNALLAGLMTAKEYADITVSMDADLQDDVQAIEKMVDENIKGADIVYGVRSSRKKDTFFKRFSAEAFYKLVKKMGVDIVFNHADFRLMSKRSLEALAEFQEVNLFLRGIVPQLGFKTAVVKYARAERELGESKYPLKKMLGFAWEGITSFSVKPLRLAFSFAAFCLFAVVALLAVGLSLHFALGYALEIYLITAAIFFVGSLTLFALGILGQYAGKIYLESKRRPRYVIESVLYSNDKTLKSK